jgi:SpoIID/LytB domain protein
MKQRIVLGLLIFGLLIFGCAVPPPILIEKAEPYIRVGLVRGVDHIDFSFQKKCRIMSYDGSFLSRGMEGRRWRAEVKQSVPARNVYRLVAGSFRDEARAREKSQDLKNNGLDTFVKPFGRRLEFNGSILNDNRYYRIYLRQVFASRENAESYRDSIWNLTETFVSSEIAQKAAGTIRLRNLETGQVFESTKPIVLRDSPVTLHEVAVGNGYHWERTEERVYPEVIRFELDNEGKLIVINELPVEEYLLGVVPSEMSGEFPVEALKAQAVAARSELLSKLGVVHQSDPFDVCSDVHCQVYSGLSKRTHKSDHAVKTTTGCVLYYNGRVCDAVYSAVCGGHGESAEQIWGSQTTPYLEGRYDGPYQYDQYGALDSEINIKQWIDARPKVYCNSIHKHCPPALEYTQKYFRWEVPYTQEEIQSIVRLKTGQEPGIILDILPMKRGVSGRITRLEIIGTLDTIEVNGELEIRKKLSENTLWSACFYIEKRGPNGLPPTGFLIKGAGWGHGVGMCQTGAAIMALCGKRYGEILSHYYHDTTIKCIY